MTSTSQQSPYPREDYFAEIGGTDSPDQPDDQGLPTKPSQDKDEISAHWLLKQTAPTFCGQTSSGAPWNGGRLAEQVAWLEADVDAARLDDLSEAVDRSDLIDGRGEQLHHELKEVELSAPTEYPPAENAGAHRHARRHNPETGYLNWGETTWIELGLLPFGQFMGVIEDAIEVFNPPPKQERKARNLAKRMKRNPEGPADKDILAEVIRQHLRKNRTEA